MEKDNIYKSKEINNFEGEMARILISTIYSTIDPIMLISTKLNIERVYVLMDKKPDENQKKSFEKLTEALGGFMEVKSIKTEVYNMVKIADDVTKVIDVLSDKDQIFINITGSRRTQALGLLYSAYARIKRINKIVYVIPEENKMVYLPKLDYNLNNSQKAVLENISKHKFKSHSELSKKMDISKGMLYRTITELINLGLLIQDDEEGFRLTDAGRIAVL